MLPELQKAKQHSDEGQYADKGKLLFMLMMQSPQDFVIDQEPEDGGHPGITHLPSGFQLHVPRTYIPAAVVKNTKRAQDLLNMADTDQWLAGRVRKDLPVSARKWVRGDDGNLAGFALVQPGKVAKQQVSGIFVDPAYRKQGLAKKLVAELSEKDAGLEAFVHDGNDPSGRLFETLGFQAEPAVGGRLFTKNASVPSDSEIASQIDTSPSEAQVEAGNYRKAKLSLHGLQISIENPKGSTRSGTSRSGKKWETTMAAHYGYIRGFSW